MSKTGKFTAEACLASLLETLKGEDINGWCSVTDGSLDGYTTEEKIGFIKEALAYIRKGNGFDSAKSEITRAANSAAAKFAPRAE
jgi:hypothetical protein